MLSFPNCKINIGLYVTQRREDGYHDIETVFYPLSAIATAKEDGSLHDVLEIVPAAETQLHFSGRQVAGNDTDNLVWKAYQLMCKKFPGKTSPLPPSLTHRANAKGGIPALDIYLHKIIPMGAGLGGGSADGAFMLQLLNDYCRLSLSKEELISLALQLGSDCPFFIYNKPQFASGRGELMNDIAISLDGYSIQLICPNVHVPTGMAFSLIQPKPAAYNLRELHNLPIAEWKSNISNDFEQPVFQLHPALAGIKRQLYEQGAVYAAMSGSGSAIYGIFVKGGKAEIKADVGFEVFYLE
jgi:4-diphosphocytidyl-2-C-methyl-D-erythritol kinase